MRTGLHHQLTPFISPGWSIASAGTSASTAPLLRSLDCPSAGPNLRTYSVPSSSASYASYFRCFQLRNTGSWRASPPFCSREFAGGASAPIWSSRQPCGSPLRSNSTTDTRCFPCLGWACSRARAWTKGHSASEPQCSWSRRGLCAAAGAS